MRLHGLEKRRKTRDERDRRIYRGPGLKQQAKMWYIYGSLEASDFEDGRKRERWEIIAWLSGWMRAPRERLISIMRRTWPQEDIYKLLYAKAPFMGILRKDAE